MVGKTTADPLAWVPVRWEGLIVAFAYDLINGRLEVVKIELWREDGGAVPAASRPPLSRLAAQALRELRTRWAPTIMRQRPSEAAVAAATVILDVPGPRRGRPLLYGPEHWAEVARVYANGGLPAVMERWVLGYSTAWRWVKRVREELGTERSANAQS